MKLRFLKNKNNLLFLLFCNFLIFNLPIVYLSLQKSTLVFRRIKNINEPKYDYEKEQLLCALGLNSGDLVQTANSLGIRVEELQDLIDKYNLRYKLDHIQEIVKALKSAKGIISQAADSLGMSVWGLTVDIYKLYLNSTLIQIRERGDKILKSIGQKGGNLKRAADLLGLTEEELTSEIEEYNLRDDIEELENIIEKIKMAGGNISQATELLDIKLGSLQDKIYQYHLQPFIKEMFKEKEEIIIALGKSAGNVEEAAKIMEMPKAEFEELIEIYQLNPEIEKIKKTVEALIKCKGNQTEAAELLGISKGEIASRIREEYHLYQLIAEIKMKIEEILSALGKSGGDLEKASQELDITEDDLEFLIEKYNLNSELEEIQKYYQALEETRWNFGETVKNLGVTRQVLMRRVDNYYLRLSRNDEKEKVIFALARAEGEITSAAQYLGISNIELEGLIARYDLAQTQDLIKDMVQAYKRCKGNVSKVAELFGKSKEWFLRKEARLYLPLTFYRIDKEIENLIEILGKGEADMEKSASIYGVNVSVMQALIANCLIWIG
jgi:DNA-binding NtrC family response regulator